MTYFHARCVYNATLACRICRSRAGASLFGGDPTVGLGRDLGETFCERLAFGVKQCRGAGIGERFGGLARRHRAGERRLHHFALDQAIIRGAAL